MATHGKRTRSFGYAAAGANGKLKPFSFERRPVGPSDVLIDIMYCGICHSDVHSVRGEWGGSDYPMVPGHEIVGRVSAVGNSVRKFKVGDTAGVGCMVGSCRKCDSCRDGAEYFCSGGGPTWTYGSDEGHIGGKTYGGYSNNMVVDEAFALKVSPGVDLAATAPLLCAGTTTYTPLAYWHVGAGQRVGILGVGGLGHVAIKLAHSMGAEVGALTSSREKAGDAVRLGADLGLLTGDGGDMKRYAGSFDLILDTVSAPHDLDRFITLLKLNGKMVIVGLPTEPFRLRASSLVHGHRVLAGSSLGGIGETQEMLDYCAKRRITSDIELIPIQKVNEAYERLVRGDVRYRFVIDMASLAGGVQ